MDFRKTFRTMATDRTLLRTRVTLTTTRVVVEISGRSDCPVSEKQIRRFRDFARQRKRSLVSSRRIDSTHRAADSSFVSRLSPLVDTRLVSEPFLARWSIPDGLPEARFAVSVPLVQYLRFHRERDARFRARTPNTINPLTERDARGSIAKDAREYTGNERGSRGRE